MRFDVCGLVSLDDKLSPFQSISFRVTAARIHETAILGFRNRFPFWRRLRFLYLGSQESVRRRNVR